MKKPGTIAVLGLLLLAQACMHADRSVVRVRGGTFAMGIDSAKIPGLEQIFGISDGRLFADEVPRHLVTVDDFELDATLVTNAQFKRFTEANPQWEATGIAAASKAKADHPVVEVTWYAAVAYCRWDGKRLPTEAEWEIAARGGRDALFPWGDEPVDATRANFSGSGRKTTSPVRSYPPNGYGLFDMAGNVWQFLADEWMPYPSTAQNNPVAGGNAFSEGQSFLQVKTRRVIRGGSFAGAPINLWVDYRDSHPPDGAREFVGFRCARSANRAPSFDNAAVPRR